ncbi:2-hydroxymuconate tautomerase family protein [Myxococcus stipitatus]|uniref:2-hydroxymuconate tautomerase family protein n=1 Tax=Myxococcus stipitatus TaxID=83455 RepID=UPI0030D2B1EC
MPYVKIEVTNDGVTREQKESLVRGVTTLLQQVLNKDPSLTFVTIDEIDTDNWGVGGELVSDLRRRRATPPSPTPAVVSPSVVADVAGEMPALLACVATYLDGLYFADTERLARVFHPRARYFSTAEGSLKELDMPTYFEVVRGRVPAAASQQPRYDRLINVDLAGPHTAMVKLECALAPRHFTDYLSLVKDQGQWRIISKVFEVRQLP